MLCKRIRVLYVEAAEDSTVGGSHRALYDLVTKLDTKRYYPVILFYQGNIFADRLRQRGFEGYLYDEQRTRERAALISKCKLSRIIEMLAMIGRRATFLRRHKIGLVHIINSPAAGCYDWLPAAKLNHIPCVAGCLGIPGPIQNPVERLMLHSFDWVMPDSDYVGNIAAEFGFRHSRLSTVYHGIDVEGIQRAVSRNRVQVRGELKVPNNTILAAMVGNIRRWKGQHVLLDALCLLPPELLRNLYVIFAGDVGPRHIVYEEELKEKVRKENLKDHVAFLGYREDVPDLMNAADIVVHASTEPEPLGIVLLEAMALGKAVVAADIGGPTEVLTKESGLLFSTSNPGDLAEALTALIVNPERRMALGEAARQRVWDFRIELNVQKTQLVYERVLKARI